MSAARFFELGFPAATAVIFLVGVLRYALFSVGSYWYFWVRNAERFRTRRIAPRAPDLSQIRHEVFWSMATLLTFGLSGWFLVGAKRIGISRMYTEVGEYGWPYFILSIFILGLVHDIYFYFAHRWILHHPKIYQRFHHQHHRSRVPTPLAAFSFHPYEAVIQVLFIHLLALVVPLHPAALMIYLAVMMAMNAHGHLGIELFTQRFRNSWLGRTLVSPTDHAGHHQAPDSNFGLYSLFLDRAFRTLRRSL